MATALEMKARLQKLDISAIVAKVSAENKEIFAEANKSQLLAGKDRRGEDMPRYRDDPYFENAQKAQEYEDWKTKISPSPDKDPGVMDLYIDGTYHNTIQSDVIGNKVDIKSSSQIYPDIMFKTGGMAHGVNPDSARLLWKHVIGPAARKEVSTETGIK